MQKSYFEPSAYNTPERVRLSLWERFLLNNRVYFTLKYAQIVLRTRKEAITGRYGDEAWTDSSYFIFKLIEKTGGQYHISGMEHIAETPDPVLFIGNHMSTLETMVLPVLIAPRRRVTFVVKESLVTHPLFGAVMRSRDPIVVGRTDPRKDLEEVINGGMELLSKGVSIVIFPQSTRSLVFRPEEFNSLGIKLAKKAGVRVVPFALKTDFWGQGKILKGLGRLDHHKPIFIRFGESFEVTGSSREENQKIIDFIQSSLTEWQK
ncbi:MAG TPA: lysophospholipid acyltransferase family protein [Bacteroidales bacterium]|nr:lysophospholipid acyltransferase family protein [Bacteroidales bacterium]